jgi:hypothetical protein
VFWKYSSLNDNEDMTGTLGLAASKTIFINIVSLLYEFFRFTDVKPCKYYFL